MGELGGLATAAAAEPVALPAAPGAHPRVGLVLSGGGARGLAHVGVLKVLERERIPVDVIAGTSMGAIVGGLYASGLSAAEIEVEVARLNWGEVFAARVDRQNLSQRRKEQDFEVSPLIEVGVGADGLKAPLGAVSSRLLESHLRRLTLAAGQVKHFDQLPTPFRAVATDMETGQAVVLADGDLATALRSSMSVPGVFAPLEVEGRILGDGGLVDNLPVDVARAMGAQRVIAVNIGTPLSRRETLGSITGVTAQMINILTEQNVQQSLRMLGPQDVLIAPQLDGLTAADFDRAIDFMRLGELQAEALVLRMQDLKLGPEAYAEWLARRKLRVQPRPVLDFVRFAGTEITHPESRPDLLASQPGQPFSVAHAERDLTMLAASGDYLRTDYRLVRMVNGEQGLIFDLEDKPWGPNYLQMGLDFSADNRGRSVFNLKLAHNRHWLDASGAEWRNFVRLGTAPMLASELYRPMNFRLPDGLEGFVAASGSVQRRTLDYHTVPEAKADAQVDRHIVALHADVGVNWRELGELRLGLQDELWRDDPTLVSSSYSLARAGQGADGGLRNERWHERGWRLRAVFDQLDHAFFPTRGWRVESQWMQGRRLSREDFADGPIRRFNLQVQGVNSWGVHTFSALTRLDLSDGVAAQIPRYGLGGFQQLSGFAPFQVSGQQVALVRLGYQVRLAPAPLTRGTFMGLSWEGGQAWEQRNDFGSGRKRTGTSLYLGADTAVGPVYGAIVHSPGIGATLMVFVGRP
ncbi:MAG: patatin-like phospholipase family protein [Proteobacteria bacterium]|uniref:patatin-like phospholipase family protein n=1 Tax=Aquabacterium sp. TaxID=1872578 RepID=UPI0035C76AE4|nr:patatin-like phospholipase family protein [Pseudomonadota bacterium]